MLVLDAGDLFLKSADLPPKHVHPKRSRARFMVSMYNHLGYQAYNVGDNDLLFGIDFLKELETDAQFDFLSANILDSLTQKPVFKPYKIYELGGKSFGLIGVASQPQRSVAGVIVENPVSSLQTYLQKLKGKVDYIVILAALKNSDERRFTQQSELETDFLLLATNYRYSHYLDKTRSGYLARCGDQGKYVGLITAKLEQKGKMLKDISKTEYQLQYTRRRLESFAKNTGEQTLEEYYGDQPAMLRVVKNLQRSATRFEQELKTAVNPLDFELLPLDKSITHDPWVLNQIKRHKAQTDH